MALQLLQEQQGGRRTAGVHTSTVKLLLGAVVG